MLVEETSLDAPHLRALDTAAAAVFAPLDLGATLEAVVGVFVPRYAEGAYVTLLDDRDEGRVAAVRHRDPLRGAALLGQLGRRASAAAGAQLTLPLTVGDQNLGAIHLCLAPEAPVFASDVLSLLHSIASRSALALRNARRFERERSVALAFQHAALVSDLPALDGYRFSAVYQAGRAEAQVGGDWYDAFVLQDGRIVVSIGDVVGSGLGAAIAMVDVRQVIRGVAQVHPDPAVMLEAADRTLRAQHPERFVTAFVAVIDRVTQHCAFANAGHPAPRIRLSDGSVQPTYGRGFPLGLDFDQRIDVHHVVLEAGSVLVLFTDGLIESTHDVTEGERRLEHTLRALRPLETEDVAEQIYRDVLQGESNDDVAILAISVIAAPPVRRWRFDPVWDDVAHRVHREVYAELAGAQLTPDALSDVDVVLSEVMGNLVRHAPGTAEVILERRAGRSVLHVLDKGPGFEFSPRLPADLYSEFGRGLFLISRLSHDFTVERRPGAGSHARIIF
ncbi:MAG: putative sensor protein [Candidatus Eremiobacteraeota bacterium]|jgi:anti-sigma regulatory factor (Ser/Thr protein kinase)|nr:putative sensor protein [Candidatus Eremiobacteraeota bacterium]